MRCKVWKPYLLFWQPNYIHLFCMPTMQDEIASYTKEYEGLPGMRVDPRIDPWTASGGIRDYSEILGGPSPTEAQRYYITHYVVEVNENRGDGQAIAFEKPAETVRLESATKPLEK